MAEVQLPAQAANYLFHHVFLPPQLPQENDGDAEMDGTLISVIISSLQRLKEFYTDSATRSSISDVITLLLNLSLVHIFTGAVASGEVHEGELIKCLSELSAGRGCVPLHIRAQNAGILIRKVGEVIYLEVFELSPRNDAVYASKGRLRRSFPACAVAIKEEDFDKPGFREAVAHTLAKMSHQSASGTQPQARKAGQSHDEGKSLVMQNDP